MPLPEGTRYRYKKGTKIRLAFNRGKVIEVVNMKTGATHSMEEFKHDALRRKMTGA